MATLKAHGKLQHEMVGDYINLSLIQDINHKELWLVLYTGFHKIISLRVNDPTETVTLDYIETQWDLFKKTGVITYRLQDQKIVKSYLNEMRKALQQKI